MSDRVDLGIEIELEVQTRVNILQKIDIPAPSQDSPKHDDAGSIKVQRLNERMKPFVSKLERLEEIFGKI